MDTNKISNANQILLGVNIIALLFLIFSDKIIAYVKQTNGVISIGDIATVISSIIMGITAVLMLWANKTAEKSVEITKKTTEAQLIMDLRKAYKEAELADKNSKEANKNTKNEETLNVLDRLAYFVSNDSISKEFAQNTFLQYLILETGVVLSEDTTDSYWKNFEQLLKLFIEWTPDYNNKYNETLSVDKAQKLYKKITTNKDTL